MPVDQLFQRTYAYREKLGRGRGGSGQRHEQGDGGRPAVVDGIIDRIAATLGGTTFTALDGLAFDTATPGQPVVIPLSGDYLDDGVIILIGTVVKAVTAGQGPQRLLVGTCEFHKGRGVLIGELLVVHGFYFMSFVSSGLKSIPASARWVGVISAGADVNGS